MNLGMRCLLLSWVIFFLLLSLSGAQTHREKLEKELYTQSQRLLAIMEKAQKDHALAAEICSGRGPFPFKPAFGSLDKMILAFLEKSQRYECAPCMQNYNAALKAGQTLCTEVEAAAAVARTEKQGFVKGLFHGMLMPVNILIGAVNIFIGLLGHELDFIMAPKAAQSSAYFLGMGAGILIFLAGAFFIKYND